MTDYRNSTKIGETPWGVTVYDYTPRSSVHAKPPAPVANRSSAPSGRPTSKHTSVLTCIEGEIVRFPANIAIPPAPLHSGERVLVAVMRYEDGSGKSRYRVRYRCGCRAYGTCQLSSWRLASPGTRCNKCNGPSKRAGGMFTGAATPEGRERARAQRLADAQVPHRRTT